MSTGSPWIEEISFTRDDKGSVALDSSLNIGRIKRFILPIIEKNKGWGTGNLVSKDFLSNPQKHKAVIDDTLGYRLNAKVWVLFFENKPAGFLMSHVYDRNDWKEDIVGQTIEAMSINPKSSWWNYAMREGAFAEDFLLKNIDKVKKALRSLRLHFECGICLHPKFQGKRTGLVDKLYKIISDGVIFGWTSSPFVVAKRRRMREHTFYFPLFGEGISTIPGLLALVYTCASLAGWSNEDWRKLPFGAASSQYFVEERGEEYIKLAREFADKRTITRLDAKRIEYVLSRKSMAGAIVSIPNF